MQVMRQLLLEKGMMGFAGGDGLGGAESNFNRHGFVLMVASFKG